MALNEEGVAVFEYNILAKCPMTGRLGLEKTIMRTVNCKQYSESMTDSKLARHAPEKIFHQNNT